MVARRGGLLASLVMGAYGCGPDAPGGSVGGTTGETVTASSTTTATPTTTASTTTTMDAPTTGTTTTTTTTFAARSHPFRSSRSARGRMSIPTRCA